MDLDPDDHQDSCYSEEGITRPYFFFFLYSVICYSYFLFIWRRDMENIPEVK